ncbi:hypothetical protein ABZX62_04930 [Streptomyces flavidovirens]|uniref:Uncharacterized protein n=1 Tax=Streptomyces flavidovirens TaxID=67298 RepID=A0ABW6RGL6_9ACTN
MGREDSDEAYVLDLCDEALGDRGERQHRFDWLRGDPGSSGRRVKLPVDSYWPSRRLVVEYRELHHDQPTMFFDKPDRMTVSGVHRGEQRALYDTRRDTQIPGNGLRLVVIRPAELTADARGRLLRKREEDLSTIHDILMRAVADTTDVPAVRGRTEQPIRHETSEERAAVDESQVLMSAKGARYHRDGNCAGRQQGVNNSDQLGRTLHPPRWVSEGDARIAGKLPCKRCAGGQ